jgi:hypothetical protein
MLDTSKDNSKATLELLFIKLFAVDEILIFSLFIKLINVAKFEASFSNQWSLDSFKTQPMIVGNKQSTIV